MRLLYIFPLLAIPASIFACAASSDDEGAGSSTNAITGSVANLQACAATVTYTSDGPNDFDVPALKDVPPAAAQIAQENNGYTLGHFKAPSVGDVYTVSYAADSKSTVELFDRNGAVLVYGEQPFDQFGNQSTGYQWFTGSSDALLDCSGTPYNLPNNNTSSSGYSSSGYSSSGYSSSGYSSSGTPTSSSSGSGPTGCDAGVTYDDAGNASQASCPGH